MFTDGATAAWLNSTQQTVYSAHTRTHTNTALRMRGKGLFLDPCIVSEIAKEPSEKASLSFGSEDRVWRRSASQDLTLIGLILQVYQCFSFKVCVLYIKADPLRIHLKKCVSTWSATEPERPVTAETGENGISRDVWLHMEAQVSANCTSE